MSRCFVLDAAIRMHAKVYLCAAAAAAAAATAAAAGAPRAHTHKGSQIGNTQLLVRLAGIELITHPVEADMRPQGLEELKHKKRLHGLSTNLALGTSSQKRASTHGSLRAPS